MKEALGGISLFEIVIFFILIFTGIMCLTINHAKAFGVKDEVINEIEKMSIKNVGDVSSLNSTTVNNIIEKLSDMGYRNTGRCPDSSWTGYTRDGRVTSGSDANFCIQAVRVSDAFDDDARSKCHGSCTPLTSQNIYPTMVYYNIALFYQLDLPIVSGFNFRVYGSTKILFG